MGPMVPLGVVGEEEKVWPLGGAMVVMAAMVTETINNSFVVCFFPVGQEQDQRILSPPLLYIIGSLFVATAEFLFVLYNFFAD